MDAQLVSMQAKLWRCEQCHVWWGSAGDDDTSLDMLIEATDEPDDLKWDAYRGWHAPGVQAQVCPDCGAPGQPVNVVFD